MNRIGIFILTLLPLFTFSQNEGNVWFFGDSVLMDFNSGNPVLLNGTDLSSVECSSSICDKDGNLLLYSNGMVRNQIHEPISNWPPLPNYASISQLSQGVLLLPINDTLIYHFNAWDSPTSIWDFAIYYSKINPIGDGGKGIAFDTHVLAIDSTQDPMIAIKDADNTGWWILSQSFRSSTFRKIHIDAGGNLTTYKQDIGSYHFIDGWSQIVASSSGQKIACTSGFGTVEVFDFDRCSGELTFFNSFEKDSILDNWYVGISFSPNEKYLYVSDQYLGRSSELNQYCLDSTDLLASERLIYETGYDYPDLVRSFGYHLLGPDGKIYIVHAVGGTDINQNAQDSLGVIHFPDLSGNLCDFKPYSYALPSGGAGSQIGLPNIPNYRIKPLAAQTASAGPVQEICPGTAVPLGEIDTTGGAVTYHWSPAQGLDDPNAAQPLASPTSDTWYHLTVTDSAIGIPCGQTFDSVLVRVVDTTGRPTVELGMDTVICQGTALILDAGAQPNYFYTWSTGADSPTVQPDVEASGEYSVLVWDTLAGGFYACRSDRDTLLVTVETPLLHEAPLGGTFCEGDVLRFGVAPMTELDYRWSPSDGLSKDNASMVETETLGNRIYTLTISDPAKVTECGVATFPVAVEGNPTGLLVYPNPSDGLLWLEAGGQSAKVRAINVLGQVFGEWDFEGTLELDCSDWGAGLYFLEWESGCGSGVTRVVVDAE